MPAQIFSLERSFLLRLMQAENPLVIRGKRECLEKNNKTAIINNPKHSNSSQYTHSIPSES